MDGARGRRAEEHDDLAERVGRDPAREVGVGARRAIRWRVDRARQDAVDIHPMLLQLGGEGFGEAYHARFGGAVARAARKT